MKKIVPLTVIAVLALIGARFAFSHCEIPCGIYDDPARFNLVAEHITTVEKSMKQIIELGEAGDKNYNQIVRWVVNKEDHATKIQDIMSQYFLTQRIKPVDGNGSDAQKKYFRQLELAHRIIVHAMKAKQTTDLEHIAKLRKNLEQFREAYMAE